MNAQDPITSPNNKTIRGIYRLMMHHFKKSDSSIDSLSNNTQVQNEYLHKIHKLLTLNNEAVSNIDKRLDDFDYQLDEVATRLNSTDTSVLDISNGLEIFVDKFTAVDIRLESIDSRLQWTEDSIFALQSQQQKLYNVVERMDNHLEGVENDIKEIYDQLISLTSKSRLRSPRPG